jgi:hypothetical protein
MAEQWEQIDGWPYEVSDLGRVRRTSDAQNWKAGRCLKPTITDGYERVTLQSNKAKRYRCVHQLVIVAFHGPAPSSDHECNHIDGVKRNNLPGNLEWVTHKRNVHHAMGIGLRRPRFGSKAPNVKLDEGKVLEIREMYAAGGCTEATLSEAFGVTAQAINRILQFKCWLKVGGPRVSREEKRERKRMAMLGNEHCVGRVPWNKGIGRAA